jgi:hypothetical protein
MGRSVWHGGGWYPGCSVVCHQPFSDPRWIPTAIEHGVHTHELFLNAVVDREWEALGEASVIGEQDLMNPCVDEKRIDVRKEAVYEIRSEP